MKEYVITLHNFEELDEFYQDMETPGGNLFIPNRVVDVTHRRPVSRNTNYMLTEEEANAISQDPRVLSIELSIEEQGITLVPLGNVPINISEETLTPTWTEGAPPVLWDKSNTIYTNVSQKNWGLLRCVEGSQRANWGKDTATKSFYNTLINVTASGKNVDVVIVDGHMNPAHPEYAVNVDGTGGTRVNQYNWFSLNPLVTYGSSSTYVYTPYIDSNGNNDHGAHVAGTAAGNTQGWAHDANIYNINPYTTDSNYLLDYIKVWHTNKPINPVTGIKNPTITNHSYGPTPYTYSVTDITSVRYNGTVYTGPFTSNQLISWGIFNSGGIVETLKRSVSLEADLYDLMQMGVIVVSSAGNSSHKVALYSSVASNEYNNYYVASGTTVFYNQGSISAAPGVICVGSISAGVDESKAGSSNCGPRVDIYAPGELIMSSVNTTTGVLAADVRNVNFYATKKSGTSMASPQVSGVLACFLETNLKASQADALNYITSTAKTNQIFSYNLGPSDSTDLQGSPNRYLYFYKQRPDNGFVGPKVNLGVRPSTGQKWPRTNIFRYGS